MEKIMSLVKKAQLEFDQMLKDLAENEGLTHDRYVRYLSMQYHLTKGVQKHFLAAIAHPSMVNKKSLRKFLFHFAIEEEPHYHVAEKDLENMNAAIHPITLDVELWWAYFNSIIQERPFVRLGATTILENISGISKDIIGKLFAQQSFINQKNSHFFVIHQHETLPHGDQIVGALEEAKLNAQELKDVEEGAYKGYIMYMRCVYWALHGKDLYK